jgi:hypothetical protein
MGAAPAEDSHSRIAQVAACIWTLLSIVNRYTDVLCALRVVGGLENRPIGISREDRGPYSFAVSQLAETVELLPSSLCGRLPVFAPSNTKVSPIPLFNCFVSVPLVLSFEAAPPLCAGIATFNALRHSGAAAAAKGV